MYYSTNSAQLLDFFADFFAITFGYVKFSSYLCTMKHENLKYEEWLTTIVNTRLLFNTVGEFEDSLDNHAIHSNGIKRCFSSPQKMRAAFRDMMVEVDILTGGDFNLPSLLTDYRRAWEFYRDNLSRRSNPQKVAMELLMFNVPPYIKEGLSEQRRAIFQKANDQNVDMALLFLLLLKAIPGYDSKDGDVQDIDKVFDSVMDLLNEFTGGGEGIDEFPAITIAREEPRKTRLMLIHHVMNIIGKYASFTDSGNIYDLSNDIKDVMVDLDIEGFWNECGGSLSRSDFWQIQHADNSGCYFLTHLSKDSEQNLKSIRYTMFLFREASGGVAAFLQHPTAIQSRLQQKIHSDKDQVWYNTDIHGDGNPDKIKCIRKLPSASWPKARELTRVTDQSVVDQYNRWIESECKIVRPYASLEYYFCAALYAVTWDYIYLATDNEDEYYQVPRDAFEGCERIQLGDNVGILTMGKKTYLAFDEFMLYIPATKKELEKYGIKIVNRIV